MLAIARGLMARPKLLMLDEPSLGLAPTVVEDVFAKIKEIHEELNISILLVEQKAVKALDLADNGYVLESGRIVLEGSVDELKNNEQVKKAYLGM